MIPPRELCSRRSSTQSPSDPSDEEAEADGLARKNAVYSTECSLVLL